MNRECWLIRELLWPDSTVAAPGKLLGEAHSESCAKEAPEATGKRAGVFFSEQVTAMFWARRRRGSNALGGL